MSYYEITQEEVKALARQHNTKRYRVIADEQHTTFTLVDALVKLLTAIKGQPRIFRNMNGELTFNFDAEVSS